MSERPPWRDPLPDADPTTFWGSLEAVDRAALHVAGRTRAFPGRTVLCRQDDEATRVFVIYAGLVEVSRTDANGYKTVLARRGPGHVIGDMSAIDSGPVSATAQLLAPAEALVIPATRFVDLCRHQPRIAWLMLTTAVARLRDSDIHRIQHRFDVRRRTGARLLQLAEAESTGYRQGQPVVLRLTQQELADIVPASLVAVTRILEELRALGALSTSRGRIQVNLDVLRGLSSVEAW
ncbi:MAG: Crp/Fnr family transcriptional regulator [Sciscionella sp.]